MTLSLLACERSAQSPNFRWSEAVTVEMINHADGGIVIEQRALGADQITAVSAWFAALDEGWRASVEIYDPALSLRLSYSDGVVLVVNLDQLNMVVYDVDGQFERALSRGQRADFLTALDS